MLIVFPLGLLGASLAFDLIHLDVGVEEGVHLNSPSSLSGRPATQDAP